MVMASWYFRVLSQWPAVQMPERNQKTVGDRCQRPQARNACAPRRYEPQIRCRSACARSYVVCSQCRRFAIRLADSRKHLLFREPTLPHCFLRIESQFFSLSLGRKSGAAQVAIQFLRPKGAPYWIVVVTKETHPARLRPPTNLILYVL
jgi:hypothetical protein